MITGRCTRDSSRQGRKRESQAVLGNRSGHLLVRCTVKRKIRSRLTGSQDRIYFLHNFLGLQWLLPATSRRTFVLRFPRPTPLASLRQAGLQRKRPPSMKRNDIAKHSSLALFID